MYQLFENLRSFRCWLWGHKFPDRDDYSHCLYCDDSQLLFVESQMKGKRGPGPQLKYKLTWLLLMTAIKSHALMQWIIEKT